MGLSIEDGPGLDVGSLVSVHRLRAPCEFWGQSLFRCHYLPKGILVKIPC